MAGMLLGGVCCGAEGAGWSEIGHSSTTASVLVASEAVCEGAVLQKEMNTEMATTG